jgi:hypothetical protein
VSPVTLTKAPLIKQGQRRNPVLASPRIKIRSVLRLILPGRELLGAPWASPATPLQFSWPPGGELLAAPRASRVSAIGLATAGTTPLQSSRKTKPAERKVTKAINGQLLSIRIRITTVAAATRTSVAQIEFAASQNRQEVTKLDENEGDEVAEFWLCPASDEKLLMYRLTLVVTLIVAFMLVNDPASRSRQR